MSAALPGSALSAPCGACGLVTAYSTTSRPFDPPTTGEIAMTSSTTAAMRC